MHPLKPPATRRPLPLAMTGRRLSIFVALIACAAAGAFAASSAARRAHPTPRSCRTALQRYRPLVADEQAAVFVIRGREVSDASPNTTTYEGCILGSRLRPVNFGTDFTQLQQGQVIRRLVLAGSMVAFDRLSVSVPGQLDGETVTVKDIRRRRTVGSYPTGRLTPQEQQIADQQCQSDPAHIPCEVGAGPTTQIVLAPSGSVAWIVNNSAQASSPTSEVWKAPVGAGPVRLASGGDIDPHSLALAGGRLYWTQAGSPRSDTLP